MAENTTEKNAEELIEEIQNRPRQERKRECKRILVPTDGSGQAFKAVNQAIHLAAVTGAEMTVMMAVIFIANIKITSDNMEKIDLTDAIKNKDIESMENKAENIIGLLGQANIIKKSQINSESYYSLETLSNAKMYKYLNLIQIVITAIIGFIQINNFRNFLKSKHIV